jgi:hypothetical protein
MNTTVTGVQTTSADMSYAQAMTVLRCMYHSGRNAAEDMLARATEADNARERGTDMVWIGNDIIKVARIATASRTTDGVTSRFYIRHYANVRV